jgi:uncharacterized protein YcfJ
MSVVRLIAAACVATSLAACAGTPETGQGPKENTGTLVGAVAGGLIGSQFGGGTGERIAAGIAGAAIGGLIGNRIGAGMDDDDKRRAYAAQMQALEAGNRCGGGVEEPDSGRYGSVVPGPAYDPTDCNAGRTRTHLYRRPAAGRARQRLPQPGRDLDRGGLIAAPSRRLTPGA